MRNHAKKGIQMPISTRTYNHGVGTLSNLPLPQLNIWLFSHIFKIAAYSAMNGEGQTDA